MRHCDLALLAPFLICLDSTMKTKCEYKRCGGLGKHETNEKTRRYARTTVHINGQALQVCEHCADLVYRDVEQHQRQIRRDRGADIPDKPQAASDILKKMFE